MYTLRTELYCKTLIIHRFKKSTIMAIGFVAHKTYPNNSIYHNSHKNNRLFITPHRVSLKKKKLTNHEQNELQFSPKSLV